MASPTQWTWVWVDSGSWWWTGRPGVLQVMGSQRVIHNWVTELNWTELRIILHMVIIMFAMPLHWFWLSMRAKSFSRVWFFIIPSTVAYEAFLSMRFSRQEYWRGLPWPPPGESSWPKDQTCIFYITCIGRQVFATNAVVIYLFHLSNLFQLLFAD